MKNQSVTRIPKHSTRSRRLASGATLLTAAICVLVALPIAAQAENSSGRKVGRGFANLGLGVLAIPGEIVQTTRERGPAIGATWGFVKGVGMMAATEVVGVWEILTCPFEFPPKFRPILDPEFPWEYFQSDS